MGKLLGPGAADAGQSRLFLQLLQYHFVAGGFTTTATLSWFLYQPDHRGPADVNILDGLLQVTWGGNCFERDRVYYNQVDRLNIKFG